MSRNGRLGGGGRSCCRTFIGVSLLRNVVGLTRILIISECSISGGEPLNVAVIGILISNACHLLSALVLERLVRFLEAPSVQGRIAFIAAALHVFSPAGLFLSAPYAESLFSLLSFLGHLFYAYSHHKPNGARYYKHKAWLLASGLCFGLATTVRSNGVLFGLIFAYDALLSLTIFVRWYPKITKSWLYASTAADVLMFLLCGPDLVTQAPSTWPLWYWVIVGLCCLNLALISLRYLLPKFQHSLIQGQSSLIQNMISTIAAGLCVAAGLVFPQYLAYAEYCLDTNSPNPPEWCSRTIPSIFSWVQSHYWFVSFPPFSLEFGTNSVPRNMGLFRYWTISNAPLFILAAPMLTLLTLSSYRDMPKSIYDIFPSRVNVANQGDSKTLDKAQRSIALLHRFALPQLALAVLAFTTFHVQIITRLASGYPLWYCYVASQIFEGRKGWTSMVVRWSVMYACVQGVLFAAFLPPA